MKKILLIMVLVMVVFSGTCFAELSTKNVIRTAMIEGGKVAITSRQAGFDRGTAYTVTISVILKKVAEKYPSLPEVPESAFQPIADALLDIAFRSPIGKTVLEREIIENSFNKALIENIRGQK